MKWQAEIEPEIFYDTVDDRRFVKMSKQDIGKTFVMTNDMFVNIEKDKEVNHYFQTGTDKPETRYQGWGYIENMLFEFLDFDWSEDQYWLCRVIDYYE